MFGCSCVVVLLFGLPVAMLVLVTVGFGLAVVWCGCMWL